jgi:hypothetical protein
MELSKFYNFKELYDFMHFQSTDLIISSAHNNA